MKMAPIIRAFLRRRMPYQLVHTGQHYDPEMNDKLFDALALPTPDVNLGVGSGSHAQQTAEIMKRFEPVLEEVGAQAVLVVGDVNSTIACALVAAKRNVPVLHVEAGLRSFDRGMPEEINRVLTDQISDVLYTTERSAHSNLAKEGIDGERVVFVGNVMIDSLFESLPKAVDPSVILAGEGISAEFLNSQYAVVTLHRPSNVDRPDKLRVLLESLAKISKKLPLVFALHPRTRANVIRFGLDELIRSPRIVVLPPQGYLEMLGLMKQATLVLTDSGGIQEETTALGVPCVTLRENTERPITISQGTNTLVGLDEGALIGTVEEILANGGKRGRSPELWDGHAADRIAEHLSDWLAQRESCPC